MRLAVVAGVLLLASYAAAECANACSGHGVCQSSDQCDCFPNYRAADCSERICPYGFAWVDSPRGDLNHDGTLTSANVAVNSFGSFADDNADNAAYEYEQFPNDAKTGKVALTGEGHFYSECSNKGLCDRTSGECVCFDGYTGSSCQRSTCPNDCSGHGVCRTVGEIVSGGLTKNLVDNAGGDRFYEGVYAKSNYQLWDSDMAQSCVCDPGYTSADCSLKLCPRGDDPLTHRPSDCGGLPCAVESQLLSFKTTLGASTASVADWVYLTYTDWTGKVWKTDVFQVNFGAGCSGGSTSNAGLAATVQAQLNAIPNQILKEVTVAAATGVATDAVTTLSAATSYSVVVTFTGKPGNLLPIALVRSPALRATYAPSTCAAAVASLTVTETDGNEEESSCSNRGICDYSTGLCKCFKGYTQDDCSVQNALAQ